MKKYLTYKKTASIGTNIILFSMLGSANLAYADNINNCSQLKNVNIENGAIITTEYIASGPLQKDPNRMFTGASAPNVDLPAHCLVRGVIDKRTGADGKPYATRFEVRLPKNWKNRFIFQGGGGTDGFLADAIGRIPIHGSTAAPALTRGYAVVTTDGGHDGLDPSFGLDQQARLDFSYAAIGKVTMAAKKIVTAYYHSQPNYSYFMGCSNGGREAMIAAQRYPLEFDGVVAGNPGFHLSRAALSEVWDTQALYKIAPKDKQGNKILANALTNEDLTLVSNAVLAQCDDKDGLKDGIINNYASCDFKPSTLQCTNDNDKNCLSKQKVSTLNTIFGGAKDSQGKQIYNSWPYDAGISATGWRLWKLGFSQDANKPDALNTKLGAGSLKYYFMTPPQPKFDTMKFDFDRDSALVYETGALNDANSTMMSTYAQRGGKMLIIQGVSDPVFSANDIRDWYLATEQNTSKGDPEAMRSWSRLFMVPGMTHCGGGPALDDMDPLTAIESWVEKQQAPDFLAAKGKAFPGKSQPLCVYPKIAKYDGKGDINVLQSYRCEE